MPSSLKVRNTHFGKEVTASGKGLYHTRVGKATSFIIHTLGRSSKEFDVIVSGPPDVVPPNEAVPVRCYQQKDGNLLAEFVTRQALVILNISGKLHSHIKHWMTTSF